MHTHIEAMSHQVLRRICKRISLPHLNQGSTLCIRTPKDLFSKKHNRNVFGNVHVKIIPEWRDDVCLKLEYFSSSDDKDSGDQQKEPNMVVDFHRDCHDTSIGRKMSLANVDIVFEGDDGSSKEGIECKTDTLNVQNEHLSYPSICMTAKVPEKMNLKCDLSHSPHFPKTDGDLLESNDDMEEDQIYIENKLEGDVSINLHEGGSIFCKKVRGYNVDFNIQKKGVIHVKKLLEAQSIKLNVSDHGRIRAKMINGSNIDLNVNNKNDCDRAVVEEFKPLDNDDGLALCDISSIYTSQTGEGANISVSSSSASRQIGSNVRVKYHHGHLNVNSNLKIPPSSTDILNRRDEYGNVLPVVDLGGMNGSTDVLSTIYHDDELSSTKDNLLAIKLHIDSLSPDSISVLDSSSGDVSISLDRKVDTDVRLLSLPSSLEGNCSSFSTDDLLLDDAEDVFDSLSNYEKKVIPEKPESLDCDRISIETDAFSESKPPSSSHPSPFQKLNFKYGQITNQSHEPDSRFDAATKGDEFVNSAGKIRVQSAALQALHGFGGGSSVTPENSTNQFLEENEKKQFLYPLLAVKTSNSGNIVVESTSWFGAIARRYGMSEDMEKREVNDLGRQAKKSVTKPSK